MPVKKEEAYNAPAQSPVIPLEQIPFLLQVIVYCIVATAVFMLWRSLMNINDRRDLSPSTIFESVFLTLPALISIIMGVGILKLCSWARKGMIWLAIYFLCFDALIISVSIGPDLMFIQVIIMCIPIILYVPAIVILTRPSVKVLFATVANRGTSREIVTEEMHLMLADPDNDN